jgi:ABC-type transport system involved in cytochrome bd biosynthesis fused ATPase/permease subunit
VDLSDVQHREENAMHLEAGQVVVRGMSHFEPDFEDGEEIKESVTIRSLEQKVAVGGKNFSEPSVRAVAHIAGQGQRQLLALARGLLKLRSSSFLIMDESTANLDHATDQTIQHVLRTGLKDVQMLVIAHRLMTVCGLDK